MIVKVSDKEQLNDKDHDQAKLHLFSGKNADAAERIQKDQKQKKLIQPVLCLFIHS